MPAMLLVASSAAIATAGSISCSCPVVRADLSIPPGDLTYAYPDPERQYAPTLPTLRWEGAREGLDNPRYLSTVEQTLAVARGDSRKPMRWPMRRLFWPSCGLTRIVMAWRHGGLLRTSKRKITPATAGRLLRPSWNSSVSRHKRAVVWPCKAQILAETLRVVKIFIICVKGGQER